jgi:hypothetical protein
MSPGAAPRGRRTRRTPGCRPGRRSAAAAAPVSPESPVVGRPGRAVVLTAPAPQAHTPAQRGTVVDCVARGDIPEGPCATAGQPQGPYAAAGQPRPAVAAGG